ncbi:hypothetical protein HID58_046114, partial [Brassica napus]
LLSPRGKLRSLFFALHRRRRRSRRRSPTPPTMAKKKKPKTSTGGSPTGSAASSASSDSSSNSSTPASSDSAVKTTSEEVKSPPVPASSDSAMKMTSDEVKSPPAPASSDPAVKSNSDEVKSSPISAPASSDPAVVSTSDKVKSLPILAHASTSPDPAANSTSSSDKNVISSAPQTKVAETTATECDANPNSQIPPTSNGVPEVTDHGTLPSLQPATSFAEAAILAETSGPVTTSDTTKASHLPLVDTPSVDGTANRASRPTKAPSTQRPGKAPIASQFPIVASQETPRNHTLDVASASKVPTAIVASTSKVHKQKRDQRVSSYNTNPRSVGLKMVHLWRLQYKTILHKRWIWKNSISI